MKKVFLISILVIVAGIFGCFMFNSNGAEYKSVEVNGKTMRAQIKGSGEKTIVMLSGWATDSPVDDFYPLWQNLSSDYKVVVLEYFGYGTSDLTDDERTNSNMVEEVRTALKNLGIEPPYILMPHSMSGLYSLYYANKHPSEVSAIIGIDMSLPQKQLEGWTEESFEKTKEANYEKKLNVSIRNQWNAFYSNSKELENVKYPLDLPVLAFLCTEQVENIDSMIKSVEMQTSWEDINNNMITNPEKQTVKILSGNHNDLAYEKTEQIVELSRQFIENL